MKSECIRPGVPLSLDHARRMMDTYVTYYNDVRLHSAIGYVSPRAKLEGRDEAIWAQRRKNLAEANRKRNLANQSEVTAEKDVAKSETLSVATAG
jgi:transposase InsO family protein